MTWTAEETVMVMEAFGKCILAPTFFFIIVGYLVAVLASILWRNAP